MVTLRSQTAAISTLLITLVLTVNTFAASKETLFLAAANALNDANSVHANILSPSSYNAGSEHYQKAEVLYAKKKETEKIQSELLEAKKYFDKAIANSKLADLTFASSLKARNAARDVDAQKLDSSNWKKAEEALIQAASKMEAGNLNRAKSKAKDAENLYRAAELTAIKNSYLDEARNLIKKANKEKVQRYAPKTLLNAEALLTSAEKELTENRYDIDYPRSLAKQSLNEAKHSFYLAEKVKTLDEGDMTTEEFLLSTEEPLIKIASALDIVPTFNQGLDDVTTTLVGNIESLRGDSYELGERKKQVDRLESDVDTLEQRLGIQSERIAKQETMKANLQKVDDLFDRSEAIVLTEGQNILIRAIGLNFKPGSDALDRQNFSLLNKLQQVIAVYPKYSILIEGHTDAFGSDAANLNLSYSRAEAVKAYLEANTQTRTDIEAIGYGESRPIASNETSEGRTKNRRIDLVLRPPLSAR